MSIRIVCHSLTLAGPCIWCSRSYEGCVKSQPPLKPNAATIKVPTETLADAVHPVSVYLIVRSCILRFPATK